MRSPSFVRNWLLLSLVLSIGCSREAPMPSPDPMPPVDPLAGKAYVEVLLGYVNYEKAAPQLAVGKPAKFKAEIALASTKGKQVKLHLGEPYQGDRPAVKAEDLTKDFAQDMAAAEKKYRRNESPYDEIVVEGTVLQLLPGNFRVILAGHKE